MPHLVHFLVNFFLVNILTMCADTSELPSTCPLWTYSSPSVNDCVCGDSLIGIIVCNQETLAVRLSVQFFCFMVFDSNGLNTTLHGTCPYGGPQWLPRNFSMSQIYKDSRLCSFYNRTGQLCGEYAENYTLPTLAVSNATIITTDGLSSYLPRFFH